MTTAGIPQTKELVDPEEKYNAWLDELNVLGEQSADAWAGMDDVARDEEESFRDELVSSASSTHQLGPTSRRDTRRLLESKFKGYSFRNSALLVLQSKYDGFGKSKFKPRDHEAVDTHNLVFDLVIRDLESLSDTVETIASDGKEVPIAEVIGGLQGQDSSYSSDLSLKYQSAYDADYEILKHVLGSANDEANQQQLGFLRRWLVEQANESPDLAQRGEYGGASTVREVVVNDLAGNYGGVSLLMPTLQALVDETKDFDPKRHQAYFSEYKTIVGDSEADSEEDMIHQTIQALSEQALSLVMNADTEGHQTTQEDLAIDHLPEFVLGAFRKYWSSCYEDAISSLVEQGKNSRGGAAFKKSVTVDDIKAAASKLTNNYHDMNPAHKVLGGRRKKRKPRKKPRKKPREAQGRKKAPQKVRDAEGRQGTAEQKKRTVRVRMEGSDDPEKVSSEIAAFCNEKMYKDAEVMECELQGCVDKIKQYYEAEQKDRLSVLGTANIKKLSDNKGGSGLFRYKPGEEVKGTDMGRIRIVFHIEGEDSRGSDNRSTTIKIKGIHAHDEFDGEYV